MKQICNRCVMDSDVPDIIFNEEGNCNYCEEFLEMMGRTVQTDNVKRKDELELFVSQVKRDGERKNYDCIIGLSGGVDSAWVLYQAKKLGLRPLAVHMDNGWNSELAQSNIEGVVKSLNVDLYTYVIDWNEYCGLMQAFFDCDVLDVELLYDNAMYAINYMLADKYGIKYILAGTNKSTEGMKMPSGWNWFKYDSANIRNIAKHNPKVKIKTFPIFGIANYIWYEYIKGVKWYSFLDLMDYVKSEAMQVLIAECGFKPYPQKHYESIFTRFYQGYILPKKFNVDKRKLHFATLVASGQMERSVAIKLLSDEPYNSFQNLEDDKNYFIKKMKWSPADLESYIARPEIGHLNYGSEKKYWDFLIHANRMVKRIFNSKSR